MRCEHGFCRATLDVSDITRSMRETTATARSMDDRRVPNGWLNTIDQWADLIDARVNPAPVDGE